MPKPERRVTGQFSQPVAGWIGAATSVEAALAKKRQTSEQEARNPLQSGPLNHKFCQNLRRGAV
jgi:hypothetical protein